MNGQTGKDCMKAGYQRLKEQTKNFSSFKDLSFNSLASPECLANENISDLCLLKKWKSTTLRKTVEVKVSKVSALSSD